MQSIKDRREREWKGLTDQEIIDFETLKEAYVTAEKESTDPSTQNGAVLVGKAQPIFGGDLPVSGFLSSANFFPKDVRETVDRWKRPLKYQYVEHAERNVIYLAARHGMKTEGATMYAAWAACSDCARAIIQAGITNLVTHHDPYADVRFGQPVSDTWKESIKVALGMLNEAGVKIRWIDRKLFWEDEVKIRFNGVLVCP